MKQKMIELQVMEAQMMCSIIDTASKRGVFAAQDMAPVGALFNKLNAKLAELTPKKEKDDTDQ